MDFLLISIEAINLYNLDENHTYKINSLKTNTHLNILFLIRCGNPLRHPKSYALYNFTEIIKAIYYIHKSVHDSRMQKRINKILKAIYHNNQLSYIKKYLERFKYIYYKTQNYYNAKSNIYLYDKYIIEIAICNLYIMHIIGNKDGIYFLVKYLKSPFYIYKNI
uniref:Uncharacterized protein n=1 Tax=Gracilaria salicornia TaxID=172968 RepID=W8DX64_9FLOR|nr:hypothetical protein [Gracilaria salicornia]AHH24524.1 hypothetical protein [Gracilaria salicornia]UAD87704.1 hypothetical protein [Gracilaria salicornia]